MAKRYLTLDEAASRARISPVELNRLREKGEVRGFADRGAWKFREDDVIELIRKRSADSDPEVPLISDSDAAKKPAPKNKPVMETKLPDPPAADLGLDSLFDDDDELGTQATTIRKGGDSEVRLVLDSDLRSSPNLGKAARGEKDSDSDVRIAPAPGDSVRLKAALKPDSDSEVRLAGDLAARTAPPKLPGIKSLGDSDSDVRLAPPAGESSRSTRQQPLMRDMGSSDSDVRLIGDSSPTSLGGGSSATRRRTAQPAPDSDSEVRIVPDLGGLGGGSQSRMERPLIDMGSDLRLAADSQSAIRPSMDSTRMAMPDLSGSGVRLQDDDDLLPGIIGLAGESRPPMLKADSGRGPKKSTSDSDVKLLNQPGARKSGSDSDVRLISPSSVSTGKISLDEDSGQSILADDSNLVLPGDSGLRLGGDSGIRLQVPADSGILLEGPSARSLKGESAGMSLAGDSGITLSADSGLTLAGDSGISLSADSGLTLADDSGITLDRTSSKPGSGKKPARGRGPLLDDDDEDLAQTAPMLLAADDDDDAPIGLAGADLDIPRLDDDEPSRGRGKKRGDTTAVVVLDEDDEIDEDSATVVRGRRGADDEIDEFAESGESLAEDDMLSEAAEAEIEESGAFEGDDDLEETFDAEGESFSDLEERPAVRAAESKAPAEWGFVSTVLPLMFSVALMVTGVVTSADLVRTVWAGGQTKVDDGYVLPLVKSLFK